MLQGTVVYEQYQEFKDEPFYGTYFAFNASPILMVNDVDLIKNMMVKDFSHFVDRNVVFDLFGGTAETDHAWNKQMTNVKGDEWKDVRFEAEQAI